MIERSHGAQGREALRRWILLLTGEADFGWSHCVDSPEGRRAVSAKIGAKHRGSKSGVGYPQTTQAAAYYDLDDACAS